MVSVRGATHGSVGRRLHCAGGGVRRERSRVGAAASPAQRRHQWGFRRSQPATMAGPGALPDTVVAVQLLSGTPCPQQGPAGRQRRDRKRFGQVDAPNDGEIDMTGCGAAWLARLTGGQEVPGSNPGSPTQSRRPERCAPCGLSPTQPRQNPKSPIGCSGDRGRRSGQSRDGSEGAPLLLDGARSTPSRSGSAAVAEAARSRFELTSTHSTSFSRAAERIIRMSSAGRTSEV